jgi:hypothetical protein
VFEDLREPTDFMKPFPSYEDVFGEPIALHKKHLLPLLSVDASVVYPDLDFWIHFVTPIEPLLEGNVGDWTGEYEDFYNNVGRIAFRFCDGKYMVQPRQVENERAHKMTRLSKVGCM